MVPNQISAALTKKIEGVDAAAQASRDLGRLFARRSSSARSEEQAGDGDAEVTTRKPRKGGTKVSRSSEVATSDDGDASE